MNEVRIKLDMRIPGDMYGFLEADSRLKKLSFEGLILLYIRQRMEKSQQ